MPKAKTHQEGLLDTWGRRNRKHTDKHCAECEKLFHPKRKSSKYCSKECMWVNNGKNQGQKEDHETWWKNSKGYIEGRIWRNGKAKRVKQHRWVMEQYLKRPLLTTEVVHHINGNTTNNNIENLQLIPFGYHSTNHNLKRKYKRGYKMNLSIEERQARSDRAKRMQLHKLGQLAIAKAEREDVKP